MSLDGTCQYFAHTSQMGTFFQCFSSIQLLYVPSSGNNDKQSTHADMMVVTVNDVMVDE